MSNSVSCTTIARKTSIVQESNSSESVWPSGKAASKWNDLGSIRFGPPLDRDFGPLVVVQTHSRGDGVASGKSFPKSSESVWPSGKAAKLISKRTSVRSASALPSDRDFGLLAHRDADSFSW